MVAPATERGEPPPHRRSLVAAHHLALAGDLMGAIDIEQHMTLGHAINEAPHVGPRQSVGEQILEQQGP